MLSDAIHDLTQRFRSGVRNADQSAILLTLRAFEMEARNMETRIEIMTGRPHMPLDGHLVSAPIVEIDHVG